MLTLGNNPYPLDEAQLISSFMGTATFGAMLVSFGVCMKILLTTTSAVNRNLYRALLAVAILMAVFDALNEALQLRHVLDAFVFYKGSGGADAELEDTGYWVDFMGTVIYVLQTLLGDGVLVYRCWMVYGGRWYGVIPSGAIYMATIALGILTIYTTRLEKFGTINNSSVAPFTTSFISISLVQNVLVTTAISVRIWFIQKSNASRDKASAFNKRLNRVIAIIIESGAIYSTSLILTLATFVTKDLTDYGWSDVVIGIIPIVFNLIIIRVHQGRTADQAMMSTLGTLPETHTLKSIRSRIESRTRASDLGDEADECNEPDDMSGIKISRTVVVEGMNTPEPSIYRIRRVEGKNQTELEDKPANGISDFA